MEKNPKVKAVVALTSALLVLSLFIIFLPPVGATDSADGSSVENRVVPVIQGCRDLNENGRIDPYENWKLPYGIVNLPPIFSDNMILQRQVPVPVWGVAPPGSKVTVSFAGQKLTTTADEDRKWMVKLEPLEASSTERKMIIEGPNTTITLSGVLVGEVWLCSGQSNMASKFSESRGRRIDPKVFEKDLSGFRFSPSGGESDWLTLSPDTQNRLSCVAYYFGIELYEKLDIPVGLIHRFRSGTPIQSWMPKSAAEEIRKAFNIPEGWNDHTNPYHLPGVEFNEKIDPIIPVAMRGVIWYQGERNAKTRTGWEYRYLLPSLIKTWREEWATRAGTKLRKFPFYYVQVPTQESPVDAEWPWLRDGMRRALDLTENTGMAVFYDYGPSLHPYYKDKKHAGHRLALWALSKDYLSKDYGQDVLVVCGPLLGKVQRKGSRLLLSFKHVGGGLRSTSWTEKNPMLKFFEIAGRDGSYVPAKARIISDNTVVVANATISEPMYVRYLFKKPEPDPEVSLINAEGLPASSFMTDDFDNHPDVTIYPTPNDVRTFRPGKHGSLQGGHPNVMVIAYGDNVSDLPAVTPEPGYEFIGWDSSPSSFEATAQYTLKPSRKPWFGLLSPTNNATISDNTPTLEWEASSDEGTGLDHYEVWIDGSNVENVTAGTTSYATSALSDGVHSWRVTAIDKAGNKMKSGGFSFEVVEPAKFELSDLSVSKAEIEPGESTTVSVQVTNTGEKGGTRTVEVSIDGQTKTGEVTLDPGASDTVTFDVTENEVGTYEVSVGGMTKGFEVVKPKGGGPESGGVPALPIIAGVIAVIAVIGVILYRRR